MNGISVPGTDKKEKTLRVFARFGLGAHGIVYCLMSLLSVMAALGFEKESAGKSDAFRKLYEQPFGRGILLIIGVAMLGYVTLRMFQAIKDTRREGNGTKGLGKRIGFLFSGLVYLALSFTALNLAFFKEGGDGNS